MKKAGFYLLKGTVYPYDILVCLGTTPEQIFEYADRKFTNCFTKEEKEGIEGIMSKKGYTLKLENRAFFLWIKSFPTKPEHHGHLAHEIFHTADLMLRGAGLTLSNDSDEAFAYLVDWITLNIYREFKL